MVQFKYSFFNIKDENAMSLKERIQEVLKFTQGENACIQFEDDKQCSNEKELKQVLKEGGIL